MAANKEWYYTKGNQQFGPITAAELKVLAFSGQISPSDLIWNEKWPEWRAAGTIKGFFSKPASPVPPPLPKSRTAAPLPTNSSRNSPPESSSESAATVALWNPFVARVLSLFLSPAFSAYLMMMNWKTLGDEVRAKRSMQWFYGFMAFLVLAIITPDTPFITKVFQIVSGLMLIVWACTDAESQVRFVKENFGTNYVRRSWWKPVGIGIGAICLYLVIFTIADFSSESANISVVKDGKLDAYPDVTLGQLVDNFLGNPQWSGFLGENDENFVNATGKMSLNGSEVEAIVQFIVYGKRFELNAFEMNGVPQNELMKATLFQKMYEEYRKGTGATATNSQSTVEITREADQNGGNRKLAAFRELVKKYQSGPSAYASTKEREAYVDELSKLQQTYEYIEFDPTANRQEAQAILELYQEKIENRYTGELMRVLGIDMQSLYLTLTR